MRNLIVMTATLVLLLGALPACADDLRPPIAPPTKPSFSQRHPKLSKPWQICKDKSAAAGRALWRAGVAAGEKVEPIQPLMNFISAGCSIASTALLGSRRF